MDDRPSFVYVTYIESSPERVWEALTDPELTALYWGHSNVSDWQAGSRREHRRVDGSGIADVTGAVLAELAPQVRRHLRRHPRTGYREGEHATEEENAPHLGRSRSGVIEYVHHESGDDEVEGPVREPQLAGVHDHGVRRRAVPPETGDHRGSGVNRGNASAGRKEPRRDSPGARAKVKHPHALADRQTGHGLLRHRREERQHPVPLRRDPVEQVNDLILPPRAISTTSNDGPASAT